MKNQKILIVTVFLITLVIFALIIFNRSTDEYHYGNSFRQNYMVNTIRLHKYGITGRRVRIGLIDAGFFTKHSVFTQTNIVDKFNSADNSRQVADTNHIPGADHGTNVLSVVGGYEKNKLIGIAYGADFILAKTDISSDRFRCEELLAVSAAKWLFTEAADIITTSLSFNKFDDADYYSPGQMDGEHSRLTKIADSLVQEGVVFTASAGNNFDNNWRIIEAPSDGYGVLAAGSVDKNRVHSFFSSCGPSADGRIKPDLSAPGEGVWTANYLPGLKNDFGWNHGTSLSAPIIAGIAALILSAHPELKNFQVAEALKKSASHPEKPDNFTGWGIPDAEKAVSYFGPAFSNDPDISEHDNVITIGAYVFSSYGLDNNSVKMTVVSNKVIAEVFAMRELRENYFVCSLGKNEQGSFPGFYFSAEDRRAVPTKFPSGRIGEYFRYDPREKKTDIFFLSHESK